MLRTNLSMSMRSMAHTSPADALAALARHKHKLLGAVGALALVTWHRADHGHRTHSAKTAAELEATETREDFLRMCRFGACFEAAMGVVGLTHRPAQAWWTCPSSC